MADLDTQTWIIAARRYMRLRRRYWRCMLGGLGLFAIFGTPLFALGDELNATVRGILMTLLFVGFLACWLGSAITWLSLFSFRCPRCGNQFIVLWTSTTRPTNHCKHCGLDLRPAAMAT